ncbi:2-oxoglutarate synthase [Desulfurococcus amylolyticus DSM 16532]|uniref:2-oxoacid oxidoreductase (ferredoxin) n=2 Tax=Desulfurococcus amylolyticus TaxID=94694 RepID=I3XR05_DESAM|nr:2-oxoglutarate synthase [Desulfurococcus amylolyticus DSM 16532]
MNNLDFLLGGPQGGGLETAMNILSKTFVLAGYGFIAEREYFSNIVGRHSYIHARVSARSIPRSLRYPVRLLVASDAETLFTHYMDLSEEAVIIYNTEDSTRSLSDIPSMEDQTRSRIITLLNGENVEPRVDSLVRYLEESKHVKTIQLDFRKILGEASRIRGIKPNVLGRYISSIIVGSVVVLTGLDKNHVRRALERVFTRRPEMVEDNMVVLKLVEAEMHEYSGFLKLDVPDLEPGKHMVLSGNDAIALGKIVAGVRYQSYYPITPAADESLLLERYMNIDFNGVKGSLIVIQMEDEIAAVTSAIGASLTGVRASTSTSGPGFDLMIEGLSYAGMNEVPIVITYYQRGGPSTGQPTRGAQSDLLSAIFAGHGEFTRVVLSSGDHMEAFYDVVEAFNIAEKYQVPVIHLLDKFLANTIATIPLPVLSEVRIERGTVVSESVKSYKRFSLDHVVSPRAFIGRPNIMWYTGDEHDEYGHIVEDPEIRRKMYEKRLAKYNLIKKEVDTRFKYTYHGYEDPDYILIGWGSVKGVCLDAIEELRGKGIKAGYLNVKMLWPFPSEVEKYLKNPERVIAVEHSYEAQIRILVSIATGLRIHRKIIKYTGRPITLNELINAVEKIVSKKTDEVVLTYGA